MIDNCILNTSVLPVYNCNNCSHFIKKKEILETTVGKYAIECTNITHPLEDCVLRGFEGHSEQPTFNQTINLPIIPKESDFLKQEGKIIKAAEDWLNTKKLLKSSQAPGILVGFIEGVKSDVAKDYWFEQFKNNFG